MLMRRIVLLAPNGQVGFELQRSLAPLGQLFCLSRADVDFRDSAATSAQVLALQPDLIVNAAAWTAVDKAETEQDAAYLLNAVLPGALAAIARQLNCWLVHYSTDYVYPGTGEQPWREDDVTAPLSVYGASKLAGDLAIQQSGARHLIFRTSWVYAARGNNFMKTMLKLAAQRESLSVVADQFGAPTPARLIASVTALALQQVLAPSKANDGHIGDKSSDKSSDKSGVYHLAAAGYTNWYQFADAIFTMARHAGVPLALQEQQFSAITTAQYPTPAQRPANSRLDLSKLEQTFGLSLPDWHSQLAQTFHEYRDAVLSS